MFEGAHVAIVTPFRASDGGVDYDTLGQLIERQITGGTRGIVPCGTTGESPTLSPAEHDEVVRFTVEAVKGRALVTAGAGSNNTAATVRMARHAADVGADAVLVITPYYNKPSQAGLLEHFGQAAEASDLPVMLYNVPGRTGVNLQPETVARLAERPTVRAVKEATGDVAQSCRILDLCDIEVLSGDDALTLPLIAIGGKGVVSVVANVAPVEMTRLVSCGLAGDLAGAQAMHRRLFPLCQAMFYDTNPVPAKAALRRLGVLPCEAVRPPLIGLAAGVEERLAAALEAFGVPATA